MNIRDEKGRFIKGSNGREKIHGLAHSRFYNIFGKVKARCNDPKNNRYAIYGGRGIKCLWNSFMAFRDDMYESYLKHVQDFGEKNTQIDRINVNGDYQKSNCRWANLSEQARNKSSNTYLYFQGQRVD